MLRNSYVVPNTPYSMRYPPPPYGLLYLIKKYLNELKKNIYFVIFPAKYTYES